ncbi:hypothetical protein D3C72_1321000 [compost metagenome]
MRGQRRDLEEGRARVEQLGHAVARQQLAACQVLGARGLAAALLHLRELLLQVVDQRAHGGRIGLEVGRPRIQFGFEFAHAVFSWLRPSCSVMASRILNFWILPVTVIGNSETNWMYLGTL